MKRTPPLPPKNVVRDVCLAFVAGIAMTYAVAWSCALWAPVRSHWNGMAASGYSGQQLIEGTGHRTLHAFSNARLTDATRLVGWPALSLRSSVLPELDRVTGAPLAAYDLPAGTLVRRGFPTDRLPAFVRAQPGRRLPLVPVWPGFLINSVFYSVLVLALYPTLDAVRRSRRERTGRCGRCRYDLTAIDAPRCPECGARRP